MTIKSVGAILEPYDHDRKISVFGFGAVPTFIGKHTSHCFPLTGNSDKTTVEGIDGVAEIYRATLPLIKFSGPTRFAPLLTEFKKHVMSRAMVYHVLLLLTDGEIHDMPETKSIIVELSYMPCSIVIIGVGEEDFKNMKFLDSDDCALTAADGVKSARDIVQFVVFA